MRKRQYWNSSGANGYKLRRQVNHSYVLLRYVLPSDSVPVTGFLLNSRRHAGITTHTPMNPALSVPNYFNEHTFAPATIEFAVENLLPRPKIQLPVCNGDHHFPAHDLPFQVRIGIVFARAIVIVMRNRRMGRQFLQPNFIIVQ